MKTELLHKYFRGETTEKEESQIVEWTESSAENKERFLKERMLFDITLFSDDSKIQRKPKGHLYLYPLIAIAAMLAIVFVMDLPHMHKPKQQLSQTIRIPAGQRAQMDLPDGSVVWLNSQTTLTYDEDFGKKDRKVTLDGEAYFEVAHNKEIPFYVQTENIKVQVTGTKFDVCSYKGSNSFIARLIEGSINLLTNSAKEEKPITSLTKGKYFSMENGKYKTGEMSSNNALAWMQRLGSRMKLWHINDRGSRVQGAAVTPILKTDSMELGTGNMDLDSLMEQALRVSVDAVILESHRNWVDGSPVKSAQVSAQFLNRILR